MKIIYGFIVSAVAVLSLYLIINYVPIQSEAAPHDVNLAIDVQQYLSFDITPGDSVDFGPYNPGAAACSNTASIAGVTTNADNGYTLAVEDGSDSDSALHKDTTYIEDYTDSIASPTVWSGYGLGFTVFAADNSKEAAWGAGTAVCDPLNKYAKAPAATTTIHTVTGYRVGEDTTSIGWKINTPLDQESGAYSGAVTFTALPVAL